MNYAASQLSAVQPSASAAVSQTAKAMKADGIDVIDLGLGEPDFDTPPHIVEAAHAAAKAGQTRYPPTDGTAALKKAIIAKFDRDNGLDFAANEIIVANGAKQILFDAFMATLEPQSEVILCAPYFGQYKDIVLILGGTPITVPCSAKDGFRLTPEALDAAITDRTRWLLLNLPSNPSGATYSQADLQALGDILRRYPDVLVMSDEIYEHILFTDEGFTSFLAANPDLRERVLIVNGVSKAYAMTGWRIGYGAGPQPLIAAMTKVQSQISSGACSVAQAAATAALDGPQDNVSAFREAFQRRRDLVVERIKEIDGLSLNAPDGAFYAYIGCAGVIGRTTPKGETITDDVAFTAYLLDHARVASVPGAAYELSPFFRISTAVVDDVLAEAMNRIADAVASLAPNQGTTL